MADDFEYLRVEQKDKQVLSHLKEMGEKLKSLKLHMLETQDIADKAKKEYEHYANVLIPAEMTACGIDSVSLSSGGKLSVVRKFYCQPNKNEADRKIIVDWLRSHNGSHLIEAEAKVSQDDIEKLKLDDIPYIEQTTINTNKLKAFLKDAIGTTTGVQQFDITEIPACVHFQEVTTTEIDI